MLVTVDWIRKNYHKFNTLYWGGNLPHNLKFKISRAKRSWGFAAFKYDYPNNTIIPTELIISNYYDSPEDVKISTLLHEMIHVADYTFHPEHFIKNHKPVHGRSYNAHGWWFLKECERLRKYGWNVNPRVTQKEQSISKLSSATKKNLENKKSNTLACVIKSDKMAFVFKTDTYKVENVNKTIKQIGNYNWKNFLKGNIESISYYKTSNIEWTSKRSCCTKLTGRNIPIQYLENYLNSYNMVKI